MKYTKETETNPLADNEKFDRVALLCDKALTSDIRLVCNLLEEMINLCPSNMVADIYYDNEEAIVNLLNRD
tara:strand:+ start:591 stop:803 length:213 start_codon:yes stop_codon:yes gene_type:complete